MQHRIIKDISDFIFIEDEPQRSDIIFLPGGAHAEVPEKGAQIYKAAHTAASRTAVALLAAGRPRGVRLFDGALLTLDYFCRTQNFKIQESLGFRALDTKKDLDARPQVLTCVRTKAHAWGRHLAGQRPQE